MIHLRTPATGALAAAALQLACGGSPGGAGQAPDEGEAAARASRPSSGFTDITAASGLAFRRDPHSDSTYYMPDVTGSGGGFLDYDGDGDLDIVLLGGNRRNSASGGAIRLFRQDRRGRFADVTRASGLESSGYAMGVAVGDLDNDGDLDLYVSRVGPDALYRNEGDGSFTDITGTSGIGNPAWGTSVALFDYDLDGWLDIYVANYLVNDTSVVCTDEAGRRDYCGPASFRGVADVLYHNLGGGRFEDVSGSSGVAAGRSKGLGVVAADFDLDGRADVYVANDGEPNHLWHNRGDGTFEDEALRLGSAVNAMGHAEASMGIALGDADADGNPDLFLTHLREETNTLYRNGGARGFRDDTRRWGLAVPSVPFTGFGTGFIDFDLDGDQDLLVVNGRVTRGAPLADTDKGYWASYAEPNAAFENDGHGEFRQVTSGMEAFVGPVATSRGLAFGDVDDDGDVDVLITNLGAPTRLLRNDAVGGHWLTVRAVDPSLSRDAIGATVSVFAGGREQRQIIQSGYSYLSANDPRAHFGLGASARGADRIVVRWPGGDVETFPGVAADRMVTVQRGHGIRMSDPEE